MPERKRKRQRIRKEPTPPRHETKQEKQTKFIISAGELAATPEQLEEIKSTLLKNAVAALGRYRTPAGDALARPNIDVEFFSLSFSLSFSLGFGLSEELISPAR